VSTKKKIKKLTNKQIKWESRWAWKC